MKTNTEVGENRSNGSSSSEMGSRLPDPATWQHIETSERYLVCSMYAEAASLASSILKGLSEFEPNFELYDMMESVGMVLVQSLKQLGRTSEILNELKLLFASIPVIPVQVLLTGVCFCISEGDYVGVREFLEVFLSGWNSVDGKCYVLVGKEDSADCTKRYDGHFVLGVDTYLEVVEVYTMILLGTILNDINLATSWVENAKIPEDRRQVLLRRLHSLHSVKATNACKGSFSSSLVDDYEDPSPDRRPKGKYPKKQAVLNLSKRLEPCLWWFRTITLKFGNTRMDCSQTSFVDEKCSSRLVAACIFIPSEPFSCCSTTGCCSKDRQVIYSIRNTYNAGVLLILLQSLPNRRCSTKYICTPLCCFTWFTVSDVHSTPSFSPNVPFVFLTWYWPIGYIPLMRRESPKRCTGYR